MSKILSIAAAAAIVAVGTAFVASEASAQQYYATPGYYVQQAPVYVPPTVYEVPTYVPPATYAVPTMQFYTTPGYLRY